MQDLLIKIEHAYLNGFKSTIDFDNGKEIVKYIEQNRDEVCHQFMLKIAKGGSIKAFSEPLAAFYKFYNSKYTYGIDSYFFANWMKFLPNDIKDGYIFNIKLPGTNDSAVNKLKWDVELMPGIDFILDTAHNFKLLAHKLEKLIIKHNYSIEEQLNMGVRYLDISIAFCQNNSTIYVSNKVACYPIMEVMQSIRAFLDDHTHEVVAININPDPYFAGSSMSIPTQDLEAILIDAMHNMIADSIDMTLSNMVESNSRLLLFGEKPFNFKQMKQFPIQKILPTDNIDDIIDTNIDPRFFKHKYNPDLYSIYSSKDLINDINENEKSVVELAEQYKSHCSSSLAIGIDNPSTSNVETIINLGVSQYFQNIS